LLSLYSRPLALEWRLLLLVLRTLLAGGRGTLSTFQCAQHIAGLTVDLPVLNQNQGPIAEAIARREEAAARFNVLQAKVLAEIDSAIEVFRISETNSNTLRSLADAQAKRRDTIAEQLKVGAVDQIDLLNAQFEYATAELVQLEGQIKLQQAAAAVEDAVQRPFDLPDEIFHSRRTDAH
jgi:outer membrane protein TolC